MQFCFMKIRRVIYNKLNWHTWLSVAPTARFSYLLHDLWITWWLPPPPALDEVLCIAIWRSKPWELFHNTIAIRVYSTWNIQKIKKQIKAILKRLIGVCLLVNVEFSGKCTHLTDWFVPLSSGFRFVDFLDSLPYKICQEWLQIKWLSLVVRTSIHGWSVYLSFLIQCAAHSYYMMVLLFSYAWSLIVLKTGMTVSPKKYAKKSSITSIWT